VICAHCGCFFCYDNADAGGGEEKRWCSPTCRKAVKRPAKRERRAERSRRQHLGCRRKVRYDSAGDAYTALRWLREAGKADADSGIYECSACAAWHVTSELWQIAG
jgi:hypothetical protein